jgi:KUP system potassium uptake protein
MGRLFGPVMLAWFLMLGGLGLYNLGHNTEVLLMFNPAYALDFAENYPFKAFFILGAVVLTITGGEALYADMGHFGRTPIRLAWFTVVWPCLLLNYAGQGALLLADPKAIENPFFLLVPDALLYPVIGLATAATVIASQAVISGVFSIARQAMQLGYLPRMTVEHTSESEIGQIYIPLLNWTLLVAVLLLVVIFKTSSNLAAAYGIAVTMTMACDTILVAFVVFSLWRWPTWRVALVAVPFLVLDLMFFAANALKIKDGGYVPLLIGGVAFFLMMTWKQGRRLVLNKLRAETLPLQLFIDNVSSTAQQVPGTAVFMTGSKDVVPHALLHNLKHNRVLHAQNVLMTVQTLDMPYVEDEKRIEMETLNANFCRVVARYGFKEQPDVPKALAQAFAQQGQEMDLMQTSFFVSRERIISTPTEGMAPWREKIFISMARNTSAVSDFFQIPPNRVVEMGSQIEI